MKKSSFIRSLFLALILSSLVCVPVFANSSLPSVDKEKPAPPHLPSGDANDSILALYYMFYTGDFSPLDTMVGSRGTDVNPPVGSKFSSPGYNNRAEVQSELENTPGLYSSVCVGFDPAKPEKFTVFFSNNNLTIRGYTANTYYQFETNGEGNWELTGIGYYPQTSHADIAHLLQVCPINELDFPDERGLPGYYFPPESDSPDNPSDGNDAAETAQPTESGVTDNPSDGDDEAETAQSPEAGFIDNPGDVNDKVEPAQTPSIFQRIFPQAYAEGCTPRRKPIDDGSEAFTQCVEYVQEIRPDALCWLVGGAYAYMWDDYALKYGAGVVTVSNVPAVGDVAVWNKECQGDYAAAGHVAIVTGVSRDSGGNWKIEVDESNGANPGAFGHRKNIPVSGCMNFIHEPGVGVNSAPDEQKAEPQSPNESEQQKPSWWQSLWCFLNPWC